MNSSVPQAPTASSPYFRALRRHPDRVAFAWAGGARTSRAAGALIGRAQLVKERKGAPHAPKHVGVVAALPLTAVGKIDKKVLRNPHWASTGGQVA